MAATLIGELLVFGVLFAVAWWSIARWNRFVRYRAESWNEITGRIESGNVNGADDPDEILPGRRSFTAELHYSYRVQGDYYAGSVSQRFLVKQLAWDFVNANKGKEIQVRYQPTKPDRSVIWKVLDEVNHAG